MLLADFRGDSLYTGLEAQFFNDRERVGHGMAVLLTRRDGRVDVVFDESLALDPAYYAVSGGLCCWQPREMRQARLSLLDDEVALDLAFELPDGRPIELHLHETPKRAPAFSLLAPAGHAFKEPAYLPIFWLEEFSFVRPVARRFDLRIGGEPCRPVRVSAPWRMARYCRRPLTASWNQRSDGPVTTLPVAEPGDYEAGGATVTVAQTQHSLGISSLAVLHGGVRLAVEHSPPVPSLADLADAEQVTGDTAVTVDGRELFGGTFGVRREGQVVDLLIDLDRPWRPPARPRAAAGVFTALRFFRTWPTTYRWRGQLDLSAEPAMLRSGWERVDRRQ